jgi:hypothetical protein
MLGLVPALSFADLPNPDTVAPAAPATSTTDPYRAFLESLDTRNAACREHSQALRTLLADREQLLRSYFRTPSNARAELTAAIGTIDRQIAIAESRLEAALATTEPGDAPGLAPVPVVDIDAIREQSRRWRRPIYLPMPPPLVIPELPTPAGEQLYLDYLGARAGSSLFARDLVLDVSQLLHERRELAYRHAHARAHERAQLERMIGAVSLHLRNTAGAIADGVTVTGW